MERGPDRGGRARRYHVPRADLAGVLAWEQLRHAVEDAVGAAVRAHPQRRWSSQMEPEAARRASRQENREPVSQQRAPARAVTATKRISKGADGPPCGYRGTTGGARSGAAAG